MNAPTGVSEPAATGARCSSCGESFVVGDRFCENCGTTLDTAVPADIDEAPSLNAEPASCACGSGTADADGYCTNCGRLLPAVTDHIEFDLGQLGAAVCDRGLRHARNEDAACLIARQGAVVAAVADGVSTSDDAGKASAAAVRSAGAALATAPAHMNDAILLSAVGAAAAAVAAVTDPATLEPDGSPRPGASVPACTLVAACLDATNVTVVSVGDSRAYWIPDEGPAEQLTMDDSWAAEAIAAGMEPDGAYADRRAHQITAWLGLDSGPLTPYIVRRNLRPPGTVVLCSDGLWNYAPELDSMTTLVREHLSAARGAPLAAARSLTEFARDCGGQDNITVILIPLPDPTRTSGAV